LPKTAIDHATTLLRSKLGTVPGPIGGLSRMFTGDEAVVVRAAKAWDSPHAGTVPVLLTSAL
jgi:hypothetical protein